MFCQARHPNQISGRELDHLLAQGWFRMGQTIFTTNFLNFNYTIYNAIWLRAVLADYSDDKSRSKIYARNSSFRSEIRPACLTIEKEVLYEKYKQGISFKTAASLKNLLLGLKEDTIYNTFEVNVYDQEKLIATGFFDMGEHSAAGIVSVYDPDYKKHSLGKYLIYLKMDYCKRMGKEFFYPGYFVPGYPLFDYKLSIGKNALQYLQFSSSEWKPISDFHESKIPLHVMISKLKALQDALKRVNINSKMVWYEFFDVSLMPDLIGADLFDFPVFLMLEGVDALNFVIVFDVKENHYALFDAYPVFRPHLPTQQEGFYTEFVIRISEKIFSCAHHADMVGLISIQMSQNN